MRSLLARPAFAPVAQQFVLAPNQGTQLPLRQESNKG
jgi:hypothetical protein